MPHLNIVRVSLIYLDIIVVVAGKTTLKIHHLAQHRIDVSHGHCAISILIGADHVMKVHRRVWFIAL